MSHPHVLDSVQQHSRGVVIADNGNNGQQRQKGGRQGNQRSCGGRGIYNRNVERGNVKTGREVVHQDYKSLCYAFLGKNEAEVFDASIRCFILVCERMTNVLFDPCTTYSYVSA